MLEKIDESQLLSTEMKTKHRTNTRVELNDYDWIEYILQTVFITKEQGFLYVRFSYLGDETSEMSVTQSFKEEVTYYVYRFCSELFLQQIEKFLLQHVETIKKEDSFCGETLMLELFNQVITQGTIQHCSTNKRKKGIS